MSVKCPKCKKPLYLLVQTKHFFGVKDVSLSDVIPDEKVDEEKSYVLNCLDCGWNGWVDDYHEAANGIIRLFRKEKNDVKNTKA